AYVKHTHAVRCTGEQSHLGIAKEPKLRNSGYPLAKGVGCRKEIARDRLVTRVAHEPEHRPSGCERSSTLGALYGLIHHGVAEPTRARERGVCAKPRLAKECQR